MKPTEELRPGECGFRGLWWENPNTRTYRTMIVIMGDSADDVMDRGAVRWLTKYHRMNVLTVAVNTDEGDDTGVHSWPLDRIEAAVRWLIDEKQMDKVGIMGISMQATLALAAASLIPELSLVIAFSPADYVPWGFHQGQLGRYRKAEWPSGGSAFSWKGQDLPYLPSVKEGEEYWKAFLSEKKKHHETHTYAFFEEAEKKEKIRNEVFIPVEKICGRIIFVAAEDDSMWPSAAYVRRMYGRLQKKGFRHGFEAFLYTYGTHLLVPERLLYSAIPVGGGLMQRMFRSGKKHPSECRAAREELEEKFSTVFDEW